MLGAVNTGSGEGAVTGRSSRRRILRWPAAWWRCGIVFTRNLLGAWAVGSVTVDPMCRKLREISNFSLSNRTIHISDHAWLRPRFGTLLTVLYSSFPVLGTNVVGCDELGFNIIISYIIRSIPKSL